MKEIPIKEIAISVWSGKNEDGSGKVCWRGTVIDGSLDIPKYGDFVELKNCDEEALEAMQLVLQQAAMTMAVVLEERYGKD